MAIDAALRQIYLPWHGRSARAPDSQYPVIEPVDSESAEQRSGRVPETCGDRGSTGIIRNCISQILDYGEGLTAEAVQRAGQAFFTTKAPGQGFGIGLFLANANIERFGGRVRLTNREGGGALHPSDITLDTSIDMTATINWHGSG